MGPIGHIRFFLCLRGSENDTYYGHTAGCIAPCPPPLNQKKKKKSPAPLSLGAGGPRMLNFVKRRRGLRENSEFFENGFMVIFEVICVPTDHINFFCLFWKFSTPLEYLNTKIDEIKTISVQNTYAVLYSSIFWEISKKHKIWSVRT